MKEQIRLLWDLQVLEQQKKAAALNKDKLSGDDLRLLWQEIRQLSQQDNAEKQELTALQQQCTTMEKELDGLSAQLQILEKRLYGGEMTHLKEMEQAKEKCEDMRRNIALREASLLEQMERCETLSARISVRAKEIEAKKREHQVKQQEAAASAQRADREISLLEEKYQGVAGRVEPQILEAYQKMKRKMANPVAKLENGICGGCRINIPTSQLSVCGSSLLYCDNCGRILFVE